MGTRKTDIYLLIEEMHIIMQLFKQLNQKVMLRMGARVGWWGETGAKMR